MLALEGIKEGELGRLQALLQYCQARERTPRDRVVVAVSERKGRS